MGEGGEVIKCGNKTQGDSYGKVLSEGVNLDNRHYILT